MTDEIMKSNDPAGSSSDPGPTTSSERPWLVEVWSATSDFFQEPLSRADNWVMGTAAVFCFGSGTPILLFVHATQVQSQLIVLSLSITGYIVGMAQTPRAKMFATVLFGVSIWQWWGPGMATIHRAYGG